jgi:hypothetical protein
MDRLMTRPLVKDVRKNIPLSVQLAVALRQLGFAKGQRVDFDHDPALGLRDWDEEKQDFIPPQLDPEFIVIRTEPDHDRKTNGNGATSYGSDKHAIAKIDRVSEAEEAFRRRLLAKADPDIDVPARPRSKIPNRGFSRLFRPLRSRSTFQKQKDEFNAE